MTDDVKAALERAGLQLVNLGELLREFGEMVGVTDIDNHHNALACPYCNPDNLSLSRQSPAASIKAIEQHRKGAKHGKGK